MNLSGACSACFWHDGIRFTCQGSGNCCHARGAYGYIYLTLEDRARLAGHLGLRTAAFTRRYCAKTEGILHLKHPERDCAFLEQSRCRVYEARPTQCRTWPFWPENMKEKVWRTEVAPTCPGIGRGRRWSREEIQAILETRREVPGLDGSETGPDGSPPP
jgi:Fe-S-cluster containining protein